ncbi:MAG: efflux RND transporter periplasmic adaptor subunit [Ignavibacteriae bacterium]|nr:efflux RND transporter periplasmic adaptor subunit [Ignavibacteriota bacterium]
MATNAKKKNRKKLYIFSGIGLIVIVLVLVIIFGGKSENIVVVQTENVKRMTITQIVEATGKIEPQTQVKINAEVSGEIIELPIKEGDRVKRGQLLVRIKPDTYIADRQQAVANVNRAKSFQQQREADLRKIESEFKRQKQLFEKGLISEADLESIKNTYDVAKANVDAAKYEVDNSQAFLDRSKENLNKTSIFSPIDGVVSQLISKLGERVSGSSFMQGTEIMTVSNLNMMEARVEVNENDVVLISLGDTARVEVDAYPNRSFAATVYQIANTAKTKGLGTQEEVTNFEVRLLLLDKNVEFRPGMSCSAKIETETKKDVLAVPLQCVTTREGKKQDQETPPEAEETAANVEPAKEKERKKPDEVVFIVDKNLARKRVVKTGISSDEYIEITDGLKEGESVVKGSYRAISRELNDSSRVRIDNKAVSVKANDE